MSGLHLPVIMGTIAVAHDALAHLAPDVSLMGISRQLGLSAVLTFSRFNGINGPGTMRCSVNVAARH